MKKGSPIMYLLLFLALVGILATFGVGLMNSIKLGWLNLTGTSDDKARIKALDDAATAIASQDKTKTVTITVQ